jgi:hypothetical protein
MVQSSEVKQNAGALKMGQKGSPETSVNNHQLALRNIPQDRKSQELSFNFVYLYLCLL